MVAQADQLSTKLHERAQSLEQQRNEQRQSMLPKVAERRSNGGTTEVVYGFASKGGALLPDLRGQSVRDVARLCAQLGVKLEARGDGRALRQDPSPGAEVQPAQTVRVDFGRVN
jgi:beta-lactam-binding protein with PASTA domain